MRDGRTNSKHRWIAFLADHGVVRVVEDVAVVEVGAALAELRVGDAPATQADLQGQWWKLPTMWCKECMMELHPAYLWLW